MLIKSIMFSYKCNLRWINIFKIYLQTRFSTLVGNPLEPDASNSEGPTTQDGGYISSYKFGLGICGGLNNTIQMRTCGGLNISVKVLKCSSKLQSAQSRWQSRRHCRCDSRSRSNPNKWKEMSEAKVRGRPEIDFGILQLQSLQRAVRQQSRKRQPGITSRGNMPQHG